MRKSLVIASLLVLVCSASAFAGVPDPSRSGVDLSGQGASCQYRFRADGGLDTMTVNITLRDAFDTPVASCSTSATVVANGGTLSLCSCDGFARGGTTDANGIVSFTWNRLGGRGSLDVCVTAHCVGNIAMGCISADYTSPDLDASCDVGGATNVIDLGIWASGLPPAYNQPADPDCSGVVDVIDLGIWAGGLGVGC